MSDGEPPINYLVVRRKARERWRYEPSSGHTVLWVAIASGVLSAPDELLHGELAAFEPSNEAVEFEALADTEFVLGYYSVQTSPGAFRNGEARILSLKRCLIQEGRLD